MASDPYLHGFDAAEQARLAEQAAFLAPWMYDGLELPQSGRLLEIGAGVGGQTAQLLTRTGSQVVALEREPRQMEAWKRGQRGQARATGVIGDARALPVRDRSLDGAFVAWLLEHVPEPVQVLREAHRVLTPGARIIALEVQNQSLTVWPPSPVIARYWHAVNSTQQGIGGDPYVGTRLGALLDHAGFTDTRVEWVPIHGDARDRARRGAVLQYFHRLLQSSAASVEGAQLGWPTMRADLAAAFDLLQANPESAFLYTFARATARKAT